MRRRITLTALPVALAALAAPGAAGAATTAHHGGWWQPKPTVVDVAVSRPELSILVQAVQKAGLVDALADRKARLTVFAPTNDAFAALLAQLGLASLDDVPVETLRAILLDHVIGEADSSWELARDDVRDIEPTTLGGLAIDYDRHPAGVNNAAVVRADLRARNGYVHVIDAVLLDPDPRPTIAGLAVATPDLSILVQAATKAGLVETLSDPAANLTVFAPTNAAFVRLLADLGFASLDDVPVDALRAILLDHVVAGELDRVDLRDRAWWFGRRTPTLGGLKLRFGGHPLRVNGIPIVASDVEGSNGTVHVIDGVLLQH